MTTCTLTEHTDEHNEIYNCDSCNEEVVFESGDGCSHSEYERHPSNDNKYCARCATRLAKTDMEFAEEANGN